MLASCFPTTTHAGYPATACQGTSFLLLTDSYLLCPPHLLRISEPSSRRQIISVSCIWHITASGLALTSHVVNSIYHNSHTTLMTSVQEPPQFACLCHDLSRACIGMFKSHLLRPYCMDDLWTTVRYPDMGAPPMPPRSVDHTGVSIKLFYDS